MLVRTVGLWRSPLHLTRFQLLPSKSNVNSRAPGRPPQLSSVAVLAAYQNMFARRALRAVPRQRLQSLIKAMSSPLVSPPPLRTSLPTSTALSMSSSSRVPRVFPTSGFQVIDPADKVGEEQLPFYNRDEYYPMRIGEVIGEHYQVVAKLGYGATSTVWLGRDLRDGKYWTLKVHINTLTHNQERVVYRHLASVTITTPNHPGKRHIRVLHDSFTLINPHGHGDHEVFVMVPLGMSLKTMQERQPTRVFEKMLVTSALDQVLVSLDYLHDAEVVHTGRSCT